MGLEAVSSPREVKDIDQSQYEKYEGFSEIT